MTDLPGGLDPKTPSGIQRIIEFVKDLYRRLLEAVIAMVRGWLAFVKGNLLLTTVLTVILATLLVVLSQCGGPSNNSAVGTTTEVSTTVVATTEPSTTLAPETTVEGTTTTSTSALPVVPSGSVVPAPPATEDKVAPTTTVAKKQKKVTATTTAPTTTTTTTLPPTTTTAAPTTTTTTLPPTTTTTTPPREVTFDFQGGGWFGPFADTVTNVTAITGLSDQDWTGVLPGGTTEFAFTMYLYRNTYTYYPSDSVTYTATNATCTDNRVQQNGSSGLVRPFFIPPNDNIRVTCTATGSGPITIVLAPPPP